MRAHLVFFMLIAALGQCLRTVLQYTRLTSKYSRVQAVAPILGLPGKPKLKKRKACANQTKVNTASDSSSFCYVLNHCNSTRRKKESPLKATKLVFAPAAVFPE